MYKFGKTSLRRLEGIHPDLRRVLDRAISMTDLDFTIVEGLRTKERQRKLVDIGASTTMNSRHLTGHAVDIAPWIDADNDGDIDGQDLFHHWPLFDRLASVMKKAAEMENVPIEWGGDWKTFKDGPHFQLSWAAYPA